MRCVLLSMSLTGCADPVAVGVPWLDVPAAVELDNAIVGQPTSWGVPVANTGTEVARISLHVSPPFGVVAGTQVVLAPGGAGELPLLLEASDYEPIFGTLRAHTSFQDVEIALTAFVQSDADGDGHDAVGAGGDDCDDQDPDRNPGMAEVCNGVDDDCSGVVDDVDPPPLWFPDNDGDGYGDASATPAEGCDRPAGYVANDTDCDDEDARTNPAASEIPFDGIDQDCDGLIDEDLLGRGSLILTEILVDPQAVADDAGRYLELYNPTVGHVDLAGVSVLVGSQATLLPASYLDPGGVLVFCAQTDPTLNGGVACAGQVAWPAGAIRIEISHLGSLRIDEVAWQGWSIPVGAALELASDRLDPDANDLPTSWCPSQVDLGSGDLGTPGTISPPCP